MIEKEQLARRMWMGTWTNYLKALLRFGKTLILTRLLIEALSPSDFGFWAYLGAVFGYILLFDFGFGKTIQKYAAEAVATRSYDKFNDVADAVFATYLVIGFFLAALAVAGSVFLPEIVTVEPEMLSYYRIVFLVMGCGCAIVFPTGCIPEILAGSQLLDYRNWAIVINQLLELVGILLILYWGGSLLALVVFISLNNLLANIIMAWFIRRKLPAVRLRPRWMKWSALRQIASFSGFIYLMAMSKLVLQKTDPIVLGKMLSLEAAGTYYAGTRLSELMRMGAGQFQETLGPAAAMHYRNGDFTALRTLFLKGQRLSIFLGIGAFTVLFPLAEGLLEVWLNLRQAPEVLAVTQWMLINALFFLIFRDVAKEILVMSGQHKLYAWTAAVECVANLALSIYLVTKIGMMGVVYGTLIPNVLVALGVLIPATIHYTKIPWIVFVWKLYVPTIFSAVLPMAALWYYASTLHHGNWNLLEVGAAGMAGGVLYLGCCAFCCINSQERAVVISRIRSKIHL